MAKDCFEFGLRFDDGQSTSEVFTQTRRLIGNIYLDLAMSRTALSAYQKNMKLREAVDGPDTLQ